MTDYESVVLVKPEVFVYRIPPLGTSRGYKAADWKLDNPDFVGRMRLVSKSNDLVLKLEDKSTGELFAKCPVDKYPGTAVESVLDSSRYFVVKIVDDSGRSALIGMGFADRGDSFDLNVALQDYFKYLEKDAKLNQELSQEAEKPKLDLSFKEGQTITINLGKKAGNAVARPRTAGGGSASPGGFSLPPPPPAGSRVAAVSATSSGANSPRASPSPANMPSNLMARGISPATAVTAASTPPTFQQQPSSNVGFQNLDFMGGAGNQGNPFSAINTQQPVFQQSFPPQFQNQPANPFGPVLSKPAHSSTTANQSLDDPAVGNLLDF